MSTMDAIRGAQQLRQLVAVGLSGGEAPYNLRPAQRPPLPAAI